MYFHMGNGLMENVEELLMVNICITFLVKA